MLHMLAYAAVSCLVFIPAAVIVGRRCRSRGNLVALLAACGVLLIPLVPYLYVESMTGLFGSSVRPATASALEELGYTPKPVRIRTLKVLWISPSYARVYVVSPCVSGGKASGYGADVIVLRKTGKEWRFDGAWDPIWSDCGSAHSNVFPPYAGQGGYTQ